MSSADYSCAMRADWPDQPDEQEQPGGGLSVQLMGAVAVRDGGCAVILSGSRVRTLLALLALSVDDVVPVERIAACLWDSDPPENVRASVQTYVGRLRRAIGRERVVTEPNGYRLAVGRGAVDLLVFAAQLAEAKAAPTEAQERDLLGTAIRSWVDVPFGDSTCPWLERFETPRWVERYMQAVERCADLDLKAGDHTELALTLGEHLGAHPLRETLWARWLTALHRSGRTAEALQHYEELRERIADELGVDPSAELRSVYASILHSDLDQAPPVAPDPDRSIAAPRLLPVDVAGFSGRAAQLNELDTELNGYGGIVALPGPGGAGKTTLVVHWSHRVADQFPDGQVFVNLRGYDTSQPLEPMDALGILLRALGVAGRQIPAEFAEREALWRRVAADRRLLVVLDNARDSTQVRPLLPGGHSLVLVTSRSQLRSLVAREAARRIAVGTMAESESVALLSSRLPKTVVSGTSGPGGDVLTELASLCGHLPLALAIAAERAGRDDQWPIEDIIASLRDEQERLHQLNAGDDDPQASLQAVFDWTYETLRDEAAYLLRLLGLAPAAGVSIESAAALAGMHVRATARLLDQLVDRHMVNEQKPGWYEIHDLTRIFALDKLNHVETQEQQNDSINRLQSWYAHTAQNVTVCIGEPHPTIRLNNIEPDIVPQDFDTSETAFIWFLDHRTAISNMVDYAALSHNHRVLCTIVPILSTLFAYTGGEHEAFRLNMLANDIARKAGDDEGEAVCATHIGTYYQRVQKYCEASEWLQRARALYAQLDNLPGELHAMTVMANVLFYQDRVEESVGLSEETLAIAQELELETRQAGVLNNLSVMYTALGRLDDARIASEQSIYIHKKFDQYLHITRSLDTYANLWLELGDYEKARRSLLEAIAIVQRIGENEHYPTLLKTLGLTEQRLGNTNQAVCYWNEAIDVLERINATDRPDASRTEFNSLIAEALCHSSTTIDSCGSLPRIAIDDF